MLLLLLTTLLGFACSIHATWGPPFSRSLYIGNYLTLHSRYETTRNEDRAGDYQRRARKTGVISSRAQLIEVCTEASLQPIFQFYLVFQDFALDTGKWSFDLANGLVVPIEYNRRQVTSVIISLLTLAASYTLRYRHYLIL